VAVGFVAAIILGALILIARHFSIAMGYTCCECSACAAFVTGFGKGSELPLTPTAAAGPASATKAGIKGSAFDSGSFGGDAQQASTTAPGPLAFAAAASSSGDDSLDLLAQAGAANTSGGSGTGQPGVCLISRSRQQYSDGPGTCLATPLGFTPLWCPRQFLLYAGMFFGI
jgi:hypothetical protein